MAPLGRKRVFASPQLLLPIGIGILLVAFALLSLSWKPESASHDLDISAGSHAATPRQVPLNLKLLLATHGRLLWYSPSSGVSQILHEGEGVHYGIVPGLQDPSHKQTNQLKSVWFILRPHNWHPATAEEQLIHVDVGTRAEISRVKINARFSHDMARLDDAVYVCSTETGEILQLDYPSMREVRRIKLFTRQEHINSLAPISKQHMLVMLHNRGMSSIAIVDMTPGQEPTIIATIPKVGDKAHGLVRWNDWLLFLDSDGGSLSRISYTAIQQLIDNSRGTAGLPDTNAGRPMRTGGITTGNMPRPEIVYKVPIPGKFLKGLAVVDSIAYFGVSVWAYRQARDDPAADSELWAVDLNTGRLIQYTKVPSHGLLNIVAAPHLSQASTYQAITTSLDSTALKAANSGLTDSKADSVPMQQSSIRGAETQFVNQGLRLPDSDQAVQQVLKKMKHLGYPPSDGGKWPNGLPRMSLAAKQRPDCWIAGVQLPLMKIDVSALKSAMLALPAEMWTDAYQAEYNAVVNGRGSNLYKFKPGVAAMYLIFSDRTIQNAYVYPYYDKLKHVVEPLLLEVLGKDTMHNIVRLQFAIMPPGTTIHVHADMGNYASHAHRIHVPVVTSPDVSFQVCPGLEKRLLREAYRAEVSDALITDPNDCTAIVNEEGLVFEVNNRILHRVENKSPDTGRLQMVIDVAEQPVARHVLAPGAACDYVKGVIICPKESVTDIQ